MSNYYGPKIVTNGLVFCLDAASSKSYPGSGSTWNDLSGNGNNGTLINGPTFSSTNKGNLVFDGTNDYADCGNGASININAGSVLAWIKTANPGSNWRGIVVKQSNYGLFAFNDFLTVYDWGNNVNRVSSRTINNGVWQMVGLSFSNNVGSPSNNTILYVNGVSVFTTTTKFLNNNQSLEIGRGDPTGSQQINGSISSVMVYNKVLSVSEILQNYNATKGRFEL